MKSELPVADKTRVRKSFDRAVASYDRVTVLQQEMGRRMRERLRLVRLQPRAILDLGAGTGFGTAALARQYRGARVIALDVACAMLGHARKRCRWLRGTGFVGGDAEKLPLRDSSFDLIYSNATLQWCPDLHRTFGEVLRVLRPGGLLMFTTFGPDTLAELRASWRSVDAQRHVNAFVDLHDIGDALLRTGLAEPVVDTERFTLTYPDAYAVMRELKLMGANSVTGTRPRGLTGKGRLRAMVDAYEQRRVDGRLPATFEVVYGHAWAPVEHARAAVPVQELLAGRGRDGQS